MPASFAALVADRLARLDAGARRLVAAAAVLGAPSTWTLVPALAELDVAAAAAGYSQAVELGLLVPEAGELRWSHGLVREVVVGSLLPIERQQLNRRAAELLLGLDSDDGDAAAAERLVSAGETGRAAEVLLRLARRAIERGGLRSAERLLERAAELGRPVEVALLRVELLTVTGRVGEALVRRDGGAGRGPPRRARRAVPAHGAGRGRRRSLGAGRRPGRPRGPARRPAVADPAGRRGPRSRTGAGGGAAGRARCPRQCGRTGRGPVRGALRARADPRG